MMTIEKANEILDTYKRTILYTLKSDYCHKYCDVILTDDYKFIVQEADLNKRREMRDMFYFSIDSATWLTCGDIEGAFADRLRGYEPHPIQTA